MQLSKRACTVHTYILLFSNINHLIFHYIIYYRAYIGY